MKLTDQAYRELRTAIVSLRMKPGERLDTENISASLGFSRAPVMEALNMLRAEGLVISRRRVGTFVSEIGREQIEEVFDAREMIEHHVAPVVIHNVSDRQIDQLKAMLDQTETLLQAPNSQAFDYPRFMALDSEFHTEFIRLSGRKIYLKWFDELAGHMQRVRYIFDGNALERSQEGHLEHHRILEALRRRDIDALRTEMLNHTRRSRAGAADILETETSEQVAR